MILKYLFHQYNNGGGLTFGSRWMKLHGDLFMGKPENKGLEFLRKDLRESYYYIKEDRNLPEGTSALRKWQQQGILLAQYREIEAADISKAASLVALISVFLCVALAAPIGKVKSSFHSPSSGSESSALSDGANEDAQWTECLSIMAKLESGELTRAQIPNIQEVNDRCERLAKTHKQ